MLRRDLKHTLYTNANDYRRRKRLWANGHHKAVWFYKPTNGVILIRTSLSMSKLKLCKRHVNSWYSSLTDTGFHVSDLHQRVLRRLILLNPIISEELRPFLYRNAVRRD